MKTGFKNRILFPLAFLALVFLALSPCRADSTDISGEYQCVGTNANGSEYRGHVSIQHNGDGYYLKWVVGNARYEGIGVVESGVLAVAYYGNGQGVVGYLIGDTALRGKWSAQGSHGTVCTEVLTKM